MNFDSFKAKWLGHVIDFDHVFKYQCVDLILEYIYECFGISGGVSGNAIDYWVKTGVNGFNAPLLSKFEKIQTEDVQKGDIVVLHGLPGNEFGHIGISTGNVNATEVEILEQNGATGSGSGTGGDVIRTRWVARERVAGVLRPLAAVVTPEPVVVHPYTIEPIAAKHVAINKPTHKWGLNYDNFTAIENNPEGDIDQNHPPIIVSAILHHNIGYNYYLEDPNVASGYNVLDCDDYVPAPTVTVNPNPAPPSAPLYAPSTDTYEVQFEVPGYATSNMAVNHTGVPPVHVPVGTYFMFNNRFDADKKLIAVNVTKTPGTPGAWINPDDNREPSNEPEPPADVETPAAAPEAPVEPPAPAAAAPDEFDKFLAEHGYATFEQPELYVAMRKVAAVDLLNKGEPKDMPEHSVTPIIGNFFAGNDEFLMPKSAYDKRLTYGLPLIDHETGLPNLELYSVVYDTSTSRDERLATHNGTFMDHVSLIFSHIKERYLAFRQKSGTIKSQK